MYSCLVLSIGVATNHWVKADYEIVGAVAFILMVILFCFGRDRSVRLLIFFWLLFYFGFTYSDFLGDRNALGSKYLTPLIVLLTNIRLYIEDLSGRLIAEPYAALLNGILLGTKTGLGFDLKQSFKTTGLTHIIAISGYNVTIVINSFYLLAKPLPYKLRMGLSLGLIFLFVILTGGSASVVRAGIMGSLVVIARLFGRKALALNSLIFAVILMILEKPSILTKDIGFQLSVAATLGLVLFNPIFTKRVGDRGVVKILPENIREALFSTLSAQILTMPIIFYYFKNLSVISPIANIIILPSIPLLMLIGFIAIMTAIIYYPLGQLIGFGAWLLLYGIVFTVEKLATIPYASVILPGYMIGLIIPYYIGVFYFIYRFNVSTKGQLREKN